MPEAHTAIAEQFEEMPQQKSAATLGMWTFLATEILFFGGMFMAYITYRNLYHGAFAEASRHTIVLYGTINTAILLTSSLTMAFAVRAAQINQIKSVVRFLLITVFLGCCFLVLKGFEYHDDLKENLWPGPHFNNSLPPQAQIFWFLYWAMTGLHAFHMIIGVCLVAGLIVYARLGRYTRLYHNPVVIVGLYWHFVDLVWIFLFPMFYLMGGHYR